MGLKFYLLIPSQVIDELAEWINVAFNKDTRPPVNDDRDYRSAVKQSTPRPLDIATESSETETETDDTGITFVPKKYQNGPSASGGSDETLSSSPKLPTIFDHPDALLNKDDDSGIESQDDESANRTPTLPSAAAPKFNTPRQGGTQITETELMRRRRLLDSHIFV